MSLIVFIPSRVGSKRVPKKNLRTFAGRPIISWVVENLLKSELISQIVISTDDVSAVKKAIAGTVGVDKCDVIMRPESQADDFTTSVDVLTDWLRKSRKPKSTRVALTYPTSVFLAQNLIAESLDILSSQPEVFVATVQHADSPDRLLSLDEGGRASFVRAEFADTRSQDTTPFFKDAAQFYVANAGTWLHRKVYRDSTIPLILPEHSTVDIDSEEDWELAELLFEKQATKLMPLAKRPGQ